MDTIKIVAQIIGKNFYTVSTNRKSYTIQRENSLYEPGLALLKEKKYAELLDLLDKPQAIAKYTFGKVKVFDGEIYYNNKKISGYLAEQILNMVQEQLPFEPVVKFLNNVMDNPNEYVREDLYKFLEYGNMPLTEDGHFLAYKYITWQYKDQYTGKFDNSIGKVVSVDRTAVVEDRNQGCAAGLHVGTLQYVGKPAEGSKRVVIVKVNPKDIVSIPTDYSFQKIRTCRYEVIGEYDAPLSKPVMVDATTAYKPNAVDYPKSNTQVEVDFKTPVDDEDEDNDDLPLSDQYSEDETLAALEKYVEGGKKNERTLGQIQSRFRRENFTLSEIEELVEESDYLTVVDADSKGRKNWVVEYIG